MYLNSGKWWTSPYNDLEETHAGIEYPRKVIIHDATLRDGEQTPGVALSTEEKIEIAKKLDAFGVERIEAGMPAVSDADYKAVKAIASLGLNAEIYAFSRAMEEDIDMAVDCGVDGVIIEIPTSVPKLKYQFEKWSNQDVIDKSVRIVSYAKSKGLKVIYFGYDTTRADYDFLLELFSTIVEKAKPDGIGIVDTMGCILPSAVKVLIKSLKEKFDVPFEIHTHNDFGMATAISFAAMEAGAEVIHTCVNGLGERTGNAALEEIATGLKVLYGYENNYDLSQLHDLSQYTQEVTKFKVNVNKSLVGDNIFVRESGIGIDLVMNQPLAMFALNPSTIGKSGGIVLGKKSGINSIKVKCQQLNIQLSQAEMEIVLKEVKSYGLEHKCTVSDEVFKSIVGNID